MHRILITLTCLMALCAVVGCVRTPDINADRTLRKQAFAAFEMGQPAKARALIAKADRHYVPHANLWRRTLELQIAASEGSFQGELRRLLQAWAEQRDDWSAEDRINAELTLAEAFQPAYAADWLYDLDPSDFPAHLRTRYNLLRSKLQQDSPALRDDTVARWRLAIRDLYTAGNLKAAAAEAERCAISTQNTEAALTAAKLFNELGDATRKEAALDLALQFDDSATIQQEIGQIRTAPLGTKTHLE
ncbi:MAG: hypothetical protein IJV69_07685 [Kiritimatiellae bacterium]|nr:hypothetical protein [Kiritimatiellia bacterium]